MSFETALKTELSAVTGLSGKVWAMDAPKDTATPYLTYETGDLSEEKTMDGFSSSGTLECTVDVFGSTYKQMKSTSALVIAEIKSWLKTTMNGGPYIQNLTFAELLPEMYEPNIDKYRKSITFTVFF